MTTWFPIGLDGRSSINVMDGAYGATGGGTSADTTAISAAIAAMSTLGKKVLVLPSGYTFLTGALTYNIANSHIVIMPGCTVKYAASQSASTSMIDIAADDVTVWLFGTLDGNRDNQGSVTTQRLIHSLGYDRIRVFGGNRAGLVKEAKGYGIWLRDGDDLQVDGVRFEETDYECVSLEARTSSQYRAKIINCWGDRSAQSGTANSTGVFKITASGSGGKWYDSEIRDCDAKMSATGDNVAIEMWALDAGGIIGGGLINNATDGPGAGIGQSIAKGVGCKLQARRAINTALGLELADCIESATEGGHVDCAGLASSIGATIDNSNVDGYGNAIRGVFVKNPAATGITLVGTSYDSVVTGNRIRMSAAGSGLEAILNDGGQRAVISDNTILCSGASTRGIVNDVAGVVIANNSITVNTGYGIVHLNANHVIMRGNHLNATGTGTAAYDLTDCQYCEATGGSIQGTWTNGCNLVSASGTLNYNLVGGWTGNGGSASVNPVNGGGTWGTNNYALPINGWTPFGTITMATIKLAASTDNWLMLSGVKAGTPTETMANGSMLTDSTNGLIYTLKSAVWTDITA